MEKLHFPHFCQPYNKNNKTFTNTNYASASRKVYIHAHKKNQGRYLTYFKRNVAICMDKHILLFSSEDIC